MRQGWAPTPGQLGAPFCAAVARDGYDFNRWRGTLANC